jgi:hypothetical protein
MLPNRDSQRPIKFAVFSGQAFDPLLVAAPATYDTIHTQHSHVHYLSCPSGVRQLPAERRDERWCWIKLASYWSLGPAPPKIVGSPLACLECSCSQAARSVRPYFRNNRAASSSSLAMSSPLRLPSRASYARLPDRDICWASCWESTRTHSAWLATGICTSQRPA